MINKIPFLGWFLSSVAAVSLSIPFWVCWSWGGIGKKYFYWLPEIYQTIPFWSCVGLFIVIAIIKGTLIPKLFSVSNTNDQSVVPVKEKTSFDWDVLKEKRD